MKMAGKIVATFFGAGFFPLAPGTVASALVVGLYKYGVQRLAWPFQALLIIGLFFTGSLVSTPYARELNQKDPRRIVIDEVCGQFIALFMVPSDWTALLLAFFLFRIFDIIKPYPIRNLERLPGGWGIMADDVGAGLVSGVVLHLFLRIV